MLERITTEQRTNDWLAFLNGDRAQWGCGKTPAEAVWSALRAFATDLKIDLVELPDPLPNRRLLSSTLSTR